MSFGATFPAVVTPAALTPAATGGAAPGTTFDTTVARTFDYSSFGAQPNNPRLSSAASGDITPDFTQDQYNRTGLTAAMAFVNHTGTAVAGFGIVARVKDNGVARAITYGTEYRAFGAALPTTTTVGKTIYFMLAWNATDSKFDTTWFQEV